MLHFLGLSQPAALPWCLPRAGKKATAALYPRRSTKLGADSAGLFVALLVLYFLVGGAIKDAGKRALSSAVQKILLNYLQVTGYATFPLHGPRLEGLFDSGYVSTVGESLINPAANDVVLVRGPFLPQAGELCGGADMAVLVAFVFLTYMER